MEPPTHHQETDLVSVVTLMRYSSDADYSTVKIYFAYLFFCDICFSLAHCRLLSGSDNFPKKTFADQISVSSSGSSGSEMEDLGSPNLSPLRYKAQVTKLLSRAADILLSTTSYAQSMLQYFVHLLYV